MRVTPGTEMGTALKPESHISDIPNYQLFHTRA